MKNSRVILFISIVAIFYYSSCGDSENISPIPSIQFIGFDKDTLTQSFFNDDTLNMVISFVDGDGDLNKDNNSDGAILVLTDLRTNETYDRFFLPEIPSSGVTRGEIIVRVFTTCCIYDDDVPPCEANPNVALNDLTLSVTLFDGSGNASNSVETSKIALKCD